MVAAVQRKPWSFSVRCSAVAVRPTPTTIVASLVWWIVGVVSAVTSRPAPTAGDSSDAVRVTLRA